MNNIENEYKSIITRVGFSLLFFLVISNLLTGGTQVISLILRNFDPNSDVVYIATELASIIAYIVSFVLPVPFFYVISKNMLRHPMELSLSLPSPHSGLKLVLIVFAGMAVITPMAYINAILFPVTNEEVLEMFSMSFSKPYMLVLSFIGTAVVPAFVEELFFRGLIISNIKPYSKSAAVVISAITFGLMHQSPTQLLYATAAGFVFGVIYVETNSIWCCITLHFVNNFVSIMHTYLYYILNENTANIIVTFGDIITILLGLISIAIVFSAIKKKSRFKQIGVFGSFDAVSADGVGSVNFFKSGVLTPTVLIYIIICIIQSIINGSKLSGI